MTREEKEELIRYLKYNLEIGADYLITDEDAVEIIKALEQEPCDDAISRQVVMDCFKKWQPYMATRLCDFEKELTALPPVTPQPKMGRWVEENINGGRKVFCSECGCTPPFEHVSSGDVYSANGYGVIHKTKFCPNCGAKMSEIPTGSEPQERSE